ncbi:MAG: AAA family ATPase, partial [Chloroflexi bacterium]|nr:AAA family ATPase [Chloroflexota bacterium]
LDPEEWAEIMNAAFKFLIEPVYRYEGTVARLMGDAILAFFGAPIAHEDDPQRAVLAGLDIVEGIRDHRETMKRQRGLDFNVRVGINTGLVVVGAVGSDMRVEYTAMGDAVNVAARMEQTAQPGAVQVSGNTHKLIAPLFDFDPLGGIEVKGKAEPVPAFRVMAPKAQPGRLRGIEGLNAPLVGREKEFATLRRSLAEVQTGGGHIVCLIGEAGLGKSRLIGELKAEWEKRTAEIQPSSFRLHPSSWSESRGISYDTARPYGQFQQHIRHLCGASESEPPETVRQKIAGLLQMNAPDQPDGTARIFEVLMSVEQDSDRSRLEGEDLKRQLFEVMLNSWRAWTANRPTVLVFDDLHWADAASVELLRHLFQLADSAPILFLCAFRPDRQAPSWLIKQAADADYHHRYAEINLDPLTAEDSNALVDGLLTVADLPPTLREMILAKAEGNPFFVEEVVRVLIESGVVVRDDRRGDPAGRLFWRTAPDVDFSRLSIPDNLQTLLVARIDRLEEDARRTLQLASVIGRSFYYRVLQLISETAAELDRQIGKLQRADLIHEAARLPELEYIFRHALTQEAAYNSILLKRRREFHRKVGETLEALFADRIEEYAPVLAHHFYEAEDARALQYYTLAGDAAYRLYANAEAVAHYARAVEVALRRSASAEQLTHLYTRRGRALDLTNRFNEALANYEEMEAKGRERGDRPMELAALMARATIYATPNPAQNSDRALTLMQQALGLARELADRVAQSKILWNLMIRNIYGSRDAGEAIEYGEQSLAIARELNLREQLAYTLNDIWYAYIAVGETERAGTAQAEARRLWRELDNLPMLADNLSTSCLHELMAGNFDQVVAFADEAYRITRSINNTWGQASSRVFVGRIYMERGELDTAMALMEEGIRLGEHTGQPATSTATRADLGWAYGTLGQVDRGFEVARLAAAKAAELGFPIFRYWTSAVSARLSLLQGDIAQAEATIQDGYVDFNPQAIVPIAIVLLKLAEGELALAKKDYAQTVTMMNDLIAHTHKTHLRALRPDALHLKARALLAQDDPDEAYQTLMPARAEAEALGSRLSLWPVLMALSDIEARRGNRDAMLALRREAAEIIGYIAGHISDADLRASFLAQPHVQFTQTP